MLSDSPTKPSLIHTVPGGKKVRGMTVLSDGLYVVRQFSNQVEVYDSNTLTLRRCLVIRKLTCAGDIASSGAHNCLYISDINEHKVHRLELKGKTTQWPVDDEHGGLTVTADEQNVMMTCSPKLRGAAACRLLEYTTYGKIVREIRLQDDIVNLSHVVQRTDGKFVVCYGLYGDQVHAVWVLNDAGRACKRPGHRSAASEVNCPRRLAVVDGGNVVAVTDQGNKRVALMNPSLMDYVVDLSKDDVGRLQWEPFSVCLDKRTRRLFVDDNKTGEILVFTLEATTIDLT